jgi:hypothetical protein
MLAVQEFPQFPTLVPLYLFDPLAVRHLSVLAWEGRTFRRLDSRLNAAVHCSVDQQYVGIYGFRQLVGRVLDVVCHV